MLALLLTLAHAQAAPSPSRWEGLPTDIVAEHVFAVPPEVVTAALGDLARVGVVVPRDCVGRWEVGQRTSGEGATAAVRYDIALMHRSLALTVSRIVPGRYVDWDHPGRKGFVTRFTVAPVSPAGDTAQEAGTAAPPATRVTMQSFFTGPTCPLRRYYHRVMKPEWEACQARTLVALDQALRSGD
jgi:hypothetical protein